MLKFKTFPQANEHFDDCKVIEGKPRLYQTPDGCFPSMTSLLSILDDGGIEQWKKRVGEDEANRIVKTAAKRGNALHDYSEKYLLNQLSRSELSGTAKTLFNRVKRYLDEIQVVIGTEVPLWNKEDRYAGRTDAIVLLQDNLTMLDHKNSRKPIDTKTSIGRKKLMKYFLQLYGYAKALKNMKGYTATHGCLIIANHETSNSNRIIVDLTDQFFEIEFKKLISAYYGKSSIYESIYFDL